MESKIKLPEYLYKLWGVWGGHYYALIFESDIYKEVRDRQIKLRAKHINAVIEIN